MGWFPWVHGMISIGPWNYCYGFLEWSPWVHGSISLGPWKRISGPYGTTLLIKRLLELNLVSISFFGVVARVSVQWSEGWWFKSLYGYFVLQLFNMISVLFPLVEGKTIRENSLLYKNVTATYHRYKGLVPQYFLQCTFYWSRSVMNNTVKIKNLKGPCEPLPWGTKLLRWSRRPLASK